jgi:hypothetical protein
MTPLLKKRKELTREQAIKLWNQKRRQGWRACQPQWDPPQAFSRKKQPDKR